MTRADDRKTMIARLRETTVVDLRAMGFKGSFPHFRRERDDRWDYLSFQFDRHGGGFAVEIGRRCGGDPPLALDVEAKRVTAFDLGGDHRERLGTLSSGTDHWFRYDGVRLLLGDRRFRRIVRQLRRLLASEAVPWWAGAS